MSIVERRPESVFDYFRGHQKGNALIPKDNTLMSVSFPEGNSVKIFPGTRVPQIALETKGKSGLLKYFDRENDEISVSGRDGGTAIQNGFTVIRILPSDGCWLTQCVSKIWKCIVKIFKALFCCKSTEASFLSQPQNNHQSVGLNPSTAEPVAPSTPAPLPPEPKPQSTISPATAQNRTSTTTTIKASTNPAQKTTCSSSTNKNRISNSS